MVICKNTSNATSANKVQERIHESVLRHLKCSKQAQNKQYFILAHVLLFKACS